MRVIQQLFCLQIFSLASSASTHYTPDVQSTSTSPEPFSFSTEFTQSSEPGTSTFSYESSTQASTYVSSIFSFFSSSKKQTDIPKPEKLTSSPEAFVSLFTTIEDTLRMVSSTERSSQFTTSDETFTTESLSESFTVDEKYGECMQKCFEKKYFPSSLSVEEVEATTEGSEASDGSTQSSLSTSTFDPSTTSSDPDLPSNNWLVDELIKVTQELHEMRVKFISLSHELTEEKKLRENLENDFKLLNESYIENFENLTQKLEIQTKEFEVCHQKLEHSQKISKYLAKLAEISKFKSGIVDKILEFDLTEELQSSNKTVMKFLMFELEGDESQVNLVSNQNLITIPSRIVDIAPKLSEFSASNCGLEFVDASSFEELESLRVLNLSKNFIEKIENETFNDLKVLKILDLSFNLIEVLEAASFQGVEKLLDLNLSNNKISSLSPGIFVNLTLLEILNLSQNSITELKLEFFPPKLSIADFYIDNNLLTLIDAKLIVALEGALMVDMSSNLCIDMKVPETGSMLELGIQVVANCSIREIILE